MKKLILSGMLLGLLTTGGALTSCKNKNKESTNSTTVNNTDTNQARQTPVEVSPDDALRRGVQDAVKDYPGVNASVNDGVVTLTGTIERDRITKLLQTVNSLNPKQVINQVQYK